MNTEHYKKMSKSNADILVEEITNLSEQEMNDLCDATDDAIESGGGFGWIKLPARDILERYWNGVMVVPERHLFVGRVDGTIGGTAQLIRTSANNEAQAFSAHVTTVFVAPWARGHGLARKMMEAIEEKAKKLGLTVLNLDVRDTQKTAIRLYEAMGYKKWGTHPFYAKINENVISGHYYTKILKGSALNDR